MYALKCFPAQDYYNVPVIKTVAFPKDKMEQWGHNRVKKQTHVLHSLLIYGHDTTAILWEGIVLSVNSAIDVGYL